MAEEVKPEQIKKTQTALNKYIKKPPLTDKLLKKPPFRFLHDIVTSVIRETGFLEGVFTSEELVADNVKDRDSKVKFLTKLISAVKQATGIAIKAKPGKIVAGLEVDKTLELLQTIAKGVSTKSNGKKAVASNNKDNKQAKESTEGKKNEKITSNDKKKIKDASPAKSIEKQASQDGKGDVDPKLGILEEGRKKSGGDEEERKKIGGDEEERKKFGGDEEERKKSGEGEERRRSRSSARTKERTEVGDELGGGEGERRNSGLRKEDNSGEEKKIARRGSSARVKETEGQAEETIESEEKKSEMRGSSGKSREERKDGADEARSEEKRSARRRESSSARDKGETPKERVESRRKEEDGERRSGRRRSGSRSREERPPEPQPEDRLVNGVDSSPPVSGLEPIKRTGSLKKSLSDEAAEDPAEPKRPQTRRASSRAAKGPLKAFADKVGELKEDEEEAGGDDAAKKKKTDEKTAKTPNGPMTLGSGDSGPTPIRPPSALGRPISARRAPPSSGRPGSARPGSARPRSARPPSAMPGQPKTRDRGEVEQDINKDKSENEVKEVVVIAENERVEDKEDMVVVENPSLQLNVVENIGEEVMEGVLIDSILQSQSELEKRKSSRGQVDIEWERDKSRQWERETARLREGVQGLTRAAGPLGKLFDFLQEDVDLAYRELGVWRKAAASFTQELAAEQRLTEETLSRHRKKLVELDTLIEEQQDGIRALKASILTNDRKIQSHISRFPAR